MDSRFFDLRSPAARKVAGDCRTLLLDRPVGIDARVSCEVAFVSHYETLAALCRDVERPGLAVFAIDEMGIAARALLTTSTHRVRSAVVGRHSRCDIWLGDDPSIALRHLAVLVSPYAPGEALRYRVVDLRTETGFTDERQVSLQAFEADGPVFIELGRYVLLFLTIEGAERWPMDAMQAWRALPAREYQSEPRARVSAPRRRRAAQRDATATGVQILAGPVDLQRDLLSGDETPAVRLTVASAAGEVRLDVGPRALRTGVLLGRYERCDSGGLQVLSHPDISRVHLFVTEVDGAVCALDVASTNGLWLGRTEVRLHEVASRDRLQLGHDLASVTVEIIA